MDLWIARDADGELWLFRVDPIWIGGLWDTRYGVEADELSRGLFPDLPPCHKQRVQLVPDGEPIRGDWQ